MMDAHITDGRATTMRGVATTRILHLADHTASVGPAKSWIWPLPRLDGVHPSILSPDESTQADGVVRIGYPARISSPDFVPVFAPQDGIITYAVRTDQGTTLCLDHSAGWSSQCSELEHVLALSTDRFRRRRKVRVRAGDVIGHVRSALRIRFELSRLIDGAWVAIDPAALIRTWFALPWFAEPPSRAGSTIAV